MLMRSLLMIFFTFMFVTNDNYGQFGLRVKYNSTKYNEWAQDLEDKTNFSEKLLPTGYEIGVDYWFRLKKRRIEFMPELAYSYSKTNIENIAINSVQLTGFHFNFNTHIYALDMEGDCNCPTFSKQGNTINKGLFFHLTPGVSYNTISSKQGENQISANKTAFKVGVGVGMDIGLSDLLTITPILSYYFTSQLPYDGYIIENGLNTNPKLLQATIRLGFRPDYGRGGRRRR